VAKVMKRPLKIVPERDISSPLSEYEIYLPLGRFFLLGTSI
jgi:hypothetical protein